MRVVDLSARSAFELKRAGVLIGHHSDNALDEARELVRAMGGRLDVESREELGTRFTVRLPLAVASQFYDSIGSWDEKVA